MTIQVGDKIPAVDLQRMGKDGVETVNSSELLAGRKVVIFGLPGAFTPTCSAAHLPGYVIHADALKAKGIDSIICLSVNDAWVMDAWGKQHNADDQVMMIADGSADFTRAIGLDFVNPTPGMGVRSQRYAMIVNDGVVEQLNVEAPKEFKVSDAETMLASL
jgi:peroxiredoxin